MPTLNPFTSFSLEPKHINEDCYIYRYHSPYRPKLYFCHTTEENNTVETNLYMGFELEFDAVNKTIGSRANKIRVIKASNDIFDSDNYIYYMLDGSIRNGLEMISQPSTFLFYNKYYSEYKTLFNYIKSLGFESRRSCGLHIHFNKDYFMDESKMYNEYCKENEEKLLMIVEKFWKQLVYISKRQYSRIERWSNKFDKTPKEIVENMDYGIFENKYHVLNFNNSSTIEFRLYSSTLDVDEFFCYLELYKNIVEAAKKLTKEEIENINFYYFLTSKKLLSFFLNQSKPCMTRKYKKYLETT